MKRKYFYTVEEENFIKTNYPLYGSTYILQKIGIQKKSLDSFIWKNKLKINKNKIIIDLNNKHLCYILGLIWADGCVPIKDRNRITIGMKTADMLNVEWVFAKLGTWRKSIDYKGTIHEIIKFRKSDKEFKNFLLENDYNKKSFMSPTKILSKIPHNNIKYFIRGVFDGDGCFFIKQYSYNKGCSTRAATITSSFDQDWTYMINIMNKLDCNYHIHKTITNKEKNHRGSTFRLSAGDIIKFGNYIYSGDTFGLERKIKKFNEIKKSYKYKKCIKT